MSNLHLTTENESSQGKSLAPLIAAFTVIILLTIILINLDTGKDKTKRNSTDTPKNIMELSGNSSPPATYRLPEADSGDLDAINVNTDLVKVKALLAENRIEEAEDKLRTILVFAPDNAQALTLFGGILYYSGREKEAEAIFRRQIKLNPKDHLAYNRLGSALAKQKRYQEAINSVAVAVGLDPNSGKAHVNLAGLYSILNDKQAALKHFRKAAKLLGKAILPLSHDPSFDNIRSSPEFQAVVSEALVKKTPESSNVENGVSVEPPSGDDK